LNCENNGAFSPVNPFLQTTIDSTSLGAAKLCWRYYYYTMIEGYTTRHAKIDLEFGSAVHKLVEHYHRWRFEGRTHDESVELALALADALTRDADWASEAADKNRASLLRFAVWYFDRWEASNYLPTVKLADGKPAVELTFLFSTPYETHTGETFNLSGHMDRLVDLNGATYVADTKTTHMTLNAKFVESFTPHNQFTLYTMASQVALAKPAQGLILDAVQVGATYLRFGRYIINRPKGVLSEWHKGLGFWLDSLSQMAENANEGTNPPESAYPQNDQACGLYGGCQFRQVCSRAPRERKAILAADYVRRHWDPTERR